ncbi:MAG TPA: gephyrin-like molybdotransferase receptor GlpR [Pseudonocardia sp.]|nr:gephyrin-like molybdotransferase receptor GlpR [Pseudonocardia sp.]
MPSSLIFTGLVVVWLLILVPAVARRRQEVARPSVAALSGRVLERPTRTRWARERDAGQRWTQEVDVMHSDDEPRGVATRMPVAPRVPAARVPADRGGPPPAPEDGDERRWEHPPPRYRPGRGGFDPEAAALAARARYATRQRVVLGLLLAAAVTAVVALAAVPEAWWVHVGVDLTLVGYLVYLRRQVRMEEAIRARRAARMGGARRLDGREATDHPREWDEGSGGWADVPDSDRSDQDSVGWDDDLDGDEPATDPDGDDVERVPGTGAPVGMLPARPREPGGSADGSPALPSLQPAPPPPLPPGTSLVEIDEADPDLHDLDGPARLPYRRAAGD